MKKIIITILLIFLISLVSSAITKIYSVEYTKPTKDIRILNIIFCIKITPKQAETALRNEIDFIIKTFPPKVNILAKAWYWPAGREEDEAPIMLTDKDKSDALIYDSKKNKIIYFEEYLKIRQ